MLLSYQQLSNRPRIFKKLTGLTLDDFETIHQQVKSSLDDEFSKLGRRPKLTTHHDRLLLLMMYYRTYVTHEFLGYFVGLDDSNVCRLFKRLEPLVAKHIHLKTTQNLNQQNNAEILCKNDYALSF